jgi:signal transduction histidine kinase
VPWQVFVPRRGPYAGCMAALRLEPSWRDRLLDVALVAVVLGFTLAQLGNQGFGEYDDSAAGADGLGVALVLLSALPLLWRRTAPWLVLGLTIAASLMLAAFDYGVHAHVGIAAALYTLAERPERTDPRKALAVALPAYAGLVALEIANLGVEVEEPVVDGVLWAGAWLAGDRRRLARQRGVDLLERYEREQRLTVAEERARLARELHDSAGHAINTIRIQAGAARVLRERDPERSAEAIETIEEVARETLEDIDRIVGALRERAAAPLEPLPGLDALPALVDRHRAGGLDFNLQMTGDAAAPIPAAVDRAGYRIAQEALTNAARHGTGSADVTIERGAERLELTVTNPVSDSSAGRPRGGRGILGMRERATLLGGSLEVGPGGGTFRVRAVLPYDRARQ